MVASGERLRVDVLGPLRVTDVRGRDVTPTGALQRRLLALLVLRRGQVVTSAEAIDALWPGAPPRDPAAALHNHVFRLRHTLPDGAIESLAVGYRLDPNAVDLDLDHLTSALDARDARAIDAILDRWTGPAFVDLDESDAARIESTRLEEMRLRAREVRAEARLAANDAGGVTAELAALADEHPLRERPRALLIDALVALGRRADALRVYDDFRRRVGDELGIEPSPALAARHAELLTAEGPAWRPPSRVPVALTSLLGRETLLARTEAALGGSRIVTLVGPGGVGKTRLLVELAQRLRDSAPSASVVFCGLSSADAHTASETISATLGIETRPGVDATTRVARALGDVADEVVLLLDNCEHVLAPVAQLVETVLGTSATVKVVATSRERLRVAGEHVVSVPPLPVDSVDSPAVTLFLERARAVAPELGASGDDARVIAEIVRRLDGLPLAIELAAARMYTHDLKEIVAAVDDRLGLLTGGSRTSTRHRSLAAAVEWSYDLLDAPLRRVFAALSVFAGSFTADDAAAACATTAATAIEALDELVERSLVSRTEDRRYVLLETLRAFAAERLDDDGATADRHARYFVEWLLGEPGVDAIERSLAELRNALERLVRVRELELAGRLVGGLIDFGFLRLRPDVLAWATAILDADPDDSSAEAPLVRVVCAYGAWLSGDVVTANDHTRRALAAARRLGTIPARVCTMCGNVELFEGNLEEARQWYQQAVDRSSGDRTAQLLAAATLLLALAYSEDDSAAHRATELLDALGARSDAMAAYVWHCAGEAVLGVDDDLARRRFTRAIEIAEETNASAVIGLAGGSRASIDARSGDPHAAASEYRRLIVHWRRAGVWSTQWTMLRAIVGLLVRLGRYHDAAVLEGAVRATDEGHRIFGPDERALAELAARVREELGEEAYAAARRTGAALDGDAAVEHALRALSVTSAAAP